MFSFYKILFYCEGECTFNILGQVSDYYLGYLLLKTYANIFDLINSETADPFPIKVKLAFSTIHRLCRHCTLLN